MFAITGGVENLAEATRGVDFTLNVTTDADGPYDRGSGWGHGPGYGSMTFSRANTGSVTATFDLTTTGGAGSRDLSDVEVWTHAINGVTTLKGSFNGGTEFDIPTHSPDAGTPSGSLAPHLPTGDITSFSVKHPGGSGNTHLFIHELRINGATVDFGRNYL